MPRRGAAGRPLTYEQMQKMHAASRAVICRPLAARFWEKVEKRGPDECWPWKGAKAGKSPRGAISLGYEQGNRVVYAHRVAWELTVGPIPAGLVIDHTCKNGLCQNPAHMRVVTQGVNATENSDSPFARYSRRTHCINEHAYAPENIRWEMKPVRNRKKTMCRVRVCLACERMTSAEREAKRAERRAERNK